MDKLTIEQKRAKWREYYWNNAQRYREAHRRYSRDRYREDAEYRERVKAKNLARYYELKKQQRL